MGLSMFKKLRLPILVMIFILFLTSVAAAEPNLRFILNGAAGVYSKGANLVVYGRVEDSKIGLPGANVFIQVTNKTKDENIFYSHAKTDRKGYFKTGFNLPEKGISIGDSIEVSVEAFQQQEIQTFNVQEVAKGLYFIGFYPRGYMKGDTVQKIPTNTKEVSLVFTKNVNYFKNRMADEDLMYPGKNEKNEDCIDVYEDNTNTHVDASVDLIDIGGDDSALYYNFEGKLLNELRKRMMLVSFDQDLKPDTTYRIEISNDLAANSSDRVVNDDGEAIKVYFTTETANSSSGGGGSSGGGSGTDTTTDSADQLGNVRKIGDSFKLNLDVSKAEKLINDTKKDVFDIDISNITDNKMAERIIQLPAKLMELVNQKQKDIAIKDTDLTVRIPFNALPSGKEVTLSIKPMNKTKLQNISSTLEKELVYELEAKCDDKAIHLLNQELTIELAIAEGIDNSERLGAYFWDEENKNWQYIGGKAANQKFRFKTNRFSQYMIAENTKTFEDITQHWAKNEIEIMAARYIIKGVSDKNFMPQANVTRAQFAAFLSRALKLEKQSDQNAFEDVQSSDWYANEVAKAAEAGLILGADGRFRPNDNITREEMALMIVRAYHYGGGKTDSLPELTFRERMAVSPWALNGVREAVGLGIIQGRPDGTFGPNELATRAEAAKVLKSLLDKLAY